MAAPVGGSLEGQNREPLDYKYWVLDVASLDNGLTYDGILRWVKSIHKLKVKVNGVFKTLDTFDPITGDEVNANAQGIVGLELRDAIIWLANNRGTTAPPNQTATLTSITINGPSSVNEGSSGTYTITGNYSDATTQQITSGVTWGSNTPNGVLTVPTNSTTNDSTTATVSATVSGKSTTKTVTINDTTVVVPPTPTLSSITINGASSINEGSSSTYTVTATYSDNSTQMISSGITWSTNAPNGIVTIPTNTTQNDSTTISITASVSNKTASKTIIVNDTTTTTPAPTPTLTSISISGPNSVNEGSNAAYTIVATYSDSSTQSISSGVTWSTNAPNGVVTIPSNQTQGDSTTITINATYNSKNASKTINVIDTTTAPIVYNTTLDKNNQTTDGMSLATGDTNTGPETLNFDLINGTSGPTISIAITSNGATSYIDFASEYSGKPYIFKNNQGTKFSGTFPSSDNLNIVY